MVDIIRLSIKTLLAHITKTTGLLVVTVLSGIGSAHAFQVTVIDQTGATITTGFRWLLEEDTSFPVTPGLQTQNSLGLDFHRSFAPIVKSGECPAAPCTIDLTVAESAKPLFVSVLPYTGYNMSGNTVDQAGTTVRVVSSPAPTARIRVQVFEDNAPVNGVPDLPQEDPLDPSSTFDPTTFSIMLEDGGGRYGHTGGQVLYDVYGNFLGTTYAKDATGNVILGPDGAPATVVSVGTGLMTPGPDGYYTIENIAPGKYGVVIIPPAGEGWSQTSTLEGSKVIDAFVKSNEPELYKEFGPPGPHTFFGFVKPTNNTAELTGSTMISGTVVGNHLTRPPLVVFEEGAPIEGCWVALHPGAVGNPAIYAAPCGEGGTFSISGVPAGNTYQLSIWQESLSTIVANYTIDNTAGGNINLGNVKVFQWFARMDNQVFLDENLNGFMDPGENVMPEQAVNIRFRNGTIYQSFPTDLSGQAPFDEIFPFFNWQVAEVDFARYKATGLTYVVDAGGFIPADNGWTTPSFGVLTPQPQVASNLLTGNNLSTTETGMVLTKGFQAFLSTTNTFFWGKAPYGPADVDNPPYGNFPGTEDIDHGTGPGEYGRFGEFDHANGGISGVITYSITRAEDDPAYAAVEEWEPGLPRVQVNLYRDANYDKQPDDMVDGIAGFTAPDVNRYPLDVFPGVEDIDRNVNGVFDYGDAIQVAWSDSWDDNLPTGCIPDDLVTPFTAHPGTPIAKTPDCYDGLRNYNQIRDAVFDGGYAFVSRMEFETTIGDPNFGLRVEVEGLPSGFYIVETDVPAGLELVKEEDKNVDFGVPWTPIVNLLPAECVGAAHTVPQYLSFQTSRIDGLPIVPAGELIDAPFATLVRPLCDRKLVSLTDGKNAATDFTLFSDVPISANAVGIVLNDVANQFDPANPNFGEKAAPSWLPVIFHDWTGQVIMKTHLDEFGRYNGRLPSTFSVNLPHATGVSPNMITGCVNDPTGNDPFFNAQYATSCFTFQYMPGSTTYLDTPVVPIAAFATQGDFPVDCELPSATPMIQSVSSVSGGPFISDTSADRTLTITSRGTAVEVLNPDFKTGGPEPKTITRDYSFGAARGVVKIGGVTLPVTSWNANQIVVNVPAGTPSGDLNVITAAGKTTEMGVYVSLFDETVVGGPKVHTVVPSANTAATPIQDAIDAAADGDLILIAPGEYFELVIMYKPVQLQGYGAYSSVINSTNAILSKFAPWRAKLEAEALNYDLVDGQVAPILSLEEGPGITVLGKIGAFAANLARIDGLTVKNALDGGGILVNGHATGLQITNNLVASNEGTHGGGIRVGHPLLTGTAGGNADADNDNMVIAHNKITQNGSTVDGGGGVSIYTGADNYALSDNFVCGNFTQGSGAGVLHLGNSNNGTIDHNTITFNQSMSQLGTVHGGGLAVMGKADPNGAVSDGTGAVRVNSNLIQGNQAGAGNGGGMYIALSMTAPINVVNNMVVNNVAGWAGGGIALADAGSVTINHNTIANNDGTATVGNLFDAALTQSTAQPGAGIAAFAHSSAAVTAVLGGTFSNPALNNNIVWHNRSFSVLITPAAVGVNISLVPDVSTPNYQDLGVIGVTGSLTGSNTITSATADVGFVGGYVNESLGFHPLLNEASAATAFQITAAFDEGGNFIDLRYGPLTHFGDYHIAATSPAVNQASTLVDPATAKDFDGSSRDRVAYAGIARDIGADEYIADTDGDSVYDDLDNCITLINGHQYNADGDLYGNRCDADLNNIGPVNTADYLIFRLAFGTSNANADIDNNGIVNTADYLIFRQLFGLLPGPSGLTP